MIDKDGVTESGERAEMLTEMSTGSEGVPLQPLGQVCNRFIKRLRSVNPVRTAAAFGALLLRKELQPNCLRLEALVHLSVVGGRGIQDPSTNLLIQGYTDVGQACGYMEDPPEDIFVGNVYSKRGNYKVLEGIWESSTFYLQRFINLADELPEGVEFKAIADAIHALLAVSDLICSRAGLQRSDRGSEQGEQTLPHELAASPEELWQKMRISWDELQEHGIEIDDLGPFIFDPSQRSTLILQSLTHSDLEAHPIAGYDGSLYVLLPTAISTAIRRFFMKYLGSGEGRTLFVRQLGSEYSKLFFQTPLLGVLHEVIRFSHMSWGAVCCITRQVDVGRYLNFVFFMDDLKGFDQVGFSDMYLGSERLCQELSLAISAMQDSASNQEDFQDGVTLLVGCGVGRGMALQLPEAPRKNWTVEFLSASDLCTISKAHKMQPLDLWRVMQMKATLLKMNVVLQDINGFLNLYAWAISLNGHLVPHAEIPEEHIAAHFLHITIVQNSLLDLRHNVVAAVDSHVEQFVDGRWCLVQREGVSYFSEDDKQPLYAHLPSGGTGGPIGACITANRCWWFELVSPVNGPDTTSFDRWKMIGVWLARAVGPLEDAFSAKLPKGAILWRCIFEEPQRLAPLDGNGSEIGAVEAISLTVDKHARTVEMRIASNFDLAIFHTENVAERALVTSFLHGVSSLAGECKTDLQGLVSQVVPNVYARHAHMFPARHFRDFIPELSEDNLITISRFDDAADKLGMGWQVRDPLVGGRVEGKAECLEYLNKLVRYLENQLCNELRSYSRESLINALLFNHEVACVSRERWHRTAAAVLALREDREATLRGMRDHEFTLNAVFQPSRILIEMALCEAKLDRGVRPGRLDISRLLSQASRLYHIGGWSDLVRWDLLRPLIIVHPLGDVHVHHEFIDTVMEDFGTATSEYRYMASVKNYSKSLVAPAFANSSEGVVDAKFLAAWKEEFNVDIDAYRRFIDAVENWAINLKKAVARIRRSELVAMADAKDIGDRIVDSLLFTPRSEWRLLPPGFESKEIAPWKFRRRLSVLRRPLLQLTGDGDYEIIVAAGLLREGFSSMVGNYYKGSYPDSHLGTSMKRYAGYARDRDGMGFNTLVSDRLIELGWKTHPEITLTKILRKSLDRDYGDVDVLAWDVDSRRILVIECKDLQFRKTYGEIAEQLSDFRGQMVDGKRDLLRKHLDRVQVLRSHAKELEKFLKLGREFAIESLIVFSNPVPMKFAEGPIRELVHLYIFSDLHQVGLKTPGPDRTESDIKEKKD